MFRQQNIINNLNTTCNQQYVNNHYLIQPFYPRVIALDIPNLEINKYNKYNKYNMDEIKKRINNTYYLKIIGLN